MAISIRLNPAEDELIRNYANIHGISVSELMRQAVLEKIEDEIDMSLYEEGIGEYRQNPKTYTLEEVERELGLK